MAASIGWPELGSPCSPAPPSTLWPYPPSAPWPHSIPDSTRPCSLPLPLPTQVDAESKFVDLGADSLDTVEIMMALEEKFDIQLDEEGAEKISTVQEAADLIADQVEAK